MNIENMDEQWPPPGCPPLEWPVLTSISERITWYRSVIQAYAALWEGHPSAPVIAPVSPSALNELETELGCTLPSALRIYYTELGALSLAEKLCTVKNSDICIQSLADAFPAIEDMQLSETDQILASELIVFGDYLGNGNMFCFHRQNGEIYYFDHDSEPYLTRFFPSAEDYLDGLMIRTLSEVYDDEEAGLELLEERFGRELVRKWLF